MTKRKYPPEFLKKLKSVTGKRPKTVINHILKHGHITTEELLNNYGYEHPPRAARDVREEGIPLETFRVKNREGRSIAAYRFPDKPQLRREKLGGRRSFSKKFKLLLMGKTGSKCSICLEEYQERYLQIDHRIPYEIAGDESAKERRSEKYLLLCGSCNRAKSWSCEHCENWRKRTKRACKTCYWASPEKYKHVALTDLRRLDLVWTGKNEVKAFEKIKKAAESKNEAMPKFVKAVLAKHLKNGVKQC